MKHGIYFSSQDTRFPGMFIKHKDTSAPLQFTSEEKANKKLEAIQKHLDDIISSYFTNLKNGIAIHIDQNDELYNIVMGAIFSSVVMASGEFKKYYHLEVIDLE